VSRILTFLIHPFSVIKRYRAGCWGPICRFNHDTFYACHKHWPGPS